MKLSANKWSLLLLTFLICVCLFPAWLHASDDPARDFGFIDFSTESPTFIRVTDKHGRYAGVYPRLDETKRIPDSRSGLSTMGGPGGMNGAMIVHPYKGEYRVSLLSEVDRPFMLHISADAPDFVRKFNGLIKGEIKKYHPFDLVMTYDPSSSSPPKVVSKFPIVVTFKGQ